MAEITPHQLPAEIFTGHAEAAVTGGRAVQVSGPRVDGNYQVGPPSTTGALGAAKAILGVAARDAAAGAKLPIYGKGTIVPGETAGGALSAGVLLEVNAAGVFVAVAAGVAVAMTMDDIASGATGPILLI